MKPLSFAQLDQRLRRLETAHDYNVLSGLYMVARLDGRSFTRLTCELRPFEASFAEGFRDAMVSTTEHLMDCGFRFDYGFT